MINSVRNTVLAVLNKNNYGYLSPQDFNLYCLQAQMDLFEDYFYSYNNWISREVNRTSGTGYANIVKGLEEVIDTFSITAPLFNESTPDLNVSNYTLPTFALNGSDYYLLNKILVYQKIKSTGSTTGTSGGQNQLIDSAATFETDGVVAGDVVGYLSSGLPFNAVVEQVVSETQIIVNENNLNAIGIDYNIYDSEVLKEVEKVTNTKITMLNNSLLTKPTLTYPAYVQDATRGKIYPTTINNQGQIICQYIRYPYAPNWTYLETSGQDPIFNPSAADYQNFELPQSDEPNLVAKILQYAGVEIREGDVVQFGQGEETLDIQETS
jgi:hypothetical protein